MNEFEQNIANLRARIAALRSRLSSRDESTEDTQVHRIYHTEPKAFREVPMIETSDYDQMKGADRFIPDWNTINKLTSINNEKEAKTVELDSLRAKLRGNK